MIPVHIASCIDYWIQRFTPSPQTVFGINETYTSKAGNSVVINYDALEVIKILAHRWGGYKMYMSKTVLEDWMIFSHESPENAAANRFANEWLIWKTRNIDNLKDAYAAYIEPYDPLVNNFFDEELTEGNKVDKDSDVDSWSSDYKETTSYGRKHLRNDTETSSVGDTINYTYGVGSDSTGSPESRVSPSTTTGTPNNAHVGTDTVQITDTGAKQWRDNGTVDVDDGSDDKTYDGTHTVDHEKTNTQAMSAIAGNSNTTGAYHDTHDFYHTRKGNMGEMTSQAMLAEELKLRKQDIIADFIKQFVHDTCVFTNDDYFDGLVDYFDEDFEGL